MARASIFAAVACAAAFMAAPSRAGGAQDGTISAGEYQRNVSFGDGAFVLHWRIDAGDRIALAMVGRTAGWVALGLGPTRGMKDADILLGWVDAEGRAHVRDSWSTGEYGPHAPDEELGGTDDVEDFGGAEHDGLTTIELVRRLSTGDRFDKPLPLDGELDVIWALGRDDGMTRHFARGSAKLNLGHGALVERGPRAGVGWAALVAHNACMSAALVLALAAAAVAANFRSRPWWFKLHRALGLSAAAFAAAGAAVAIASVREYAASPHMQVGIAAALGLVLSPWAGLIGARSASGGWNAAHRWIGRIAVLLALFAFLMGLRAAGIL